MCVCVCVCVHVMAGLIWTKDVTVTAQDPDPSSITVSGRETNCGLVFNKHATCVVEVDPADTSVKINGKDLPRFNPLYRYFGYVRNRVCSTQTRRMVCLNLVRVCVRVCVCVCVSVCVCVCVCAHQPTSRA